MHETLRSCEKADARVSTMSPRGLQAHDETSKKQVESSVLCISNALLPNDLHADVAMSLQESIIQRMQKKRRGQGSRMGERPSLCLRPLMFNFFFNGCIRYTFNSSSAKRKREEEEKKIRNVNSGVLTHPDLNSRSTTYWLHKYGTSHLSGS